MAGKKENDMFLMLILFFSLISAFVWTILCHDRTRFVRVVFLYFNGIYFVLSAAKGYLDDWQNTLPQSFWDMENRTYIHYGIPIALFCVVMLLLLWKGKWFLDNRIVDAFCAILFLGIVLVFFVNGKINNRAYCILFQACVCLALAVKYAYKKEFVYCQGKAFREEIDKAAPYIRAWVWMHCVFLPNELYINNLDEFTGAYGPFLAITVYGACVTAVILVLGEIFLLPKAWMTKANLFFMAITLMGYIQNLFLNGRMESLDGDVQMWTTTQQVVNSILWLAVFVVLGIWQKAAMKVGRIVCTYIILIQAVTLGYLILTTDFGSSRQSQEMTIQNSLEIAEQQNVLVFVLDRFDSSWMETLYEEDAAFCAPLKDFVFYRNATSQFANTGPAIPYLLTATAWEEACGADGYSDYAYQKSTLLQDMKQQGFDLGIYTNAGLVSEQLYDEISNYNAAVQKTYDIGATVYTTWRCAMYQTVPFVLKNRYTYYSDDIADMVKAPQVWDTENDFPFSERLQGEGLVISDMYAKAFRFYHMHGAHEPYTFSEDMKYDKTGRASGLFSQIRGSMRIVYMYMEQLKALGKYEDATIIITADHGQQTDFIEETGKPQRVSSPVIMIKEPHQTEDKLQVQEIPVSQAEMLASMAQAAGLDTHKYGATLDEAVDDPAKERTFMKLYPEFVRYTIVGDVQDIDNWRGEILQDMLHK